MGHLKEATRINPEGAEAHALLSSAYGRQIGLSPVKSMFIGPKAGKASKKAMELAPDNPRVVLSAAIGDFNTPRMFGGNKERAMQGFQRAAELFALERPAEPVEPVWGHSEAYAWLGLAYMDRDWKCSLPWCLLVSGGGRLSRGHVKRCVNEIRRPAPTFSWWMSFRS